MKFLKPIKKGVLQSSRFVIFNNTESRKRPLRPFPLILTAFPRPWVSFFPPTLKTRLQGFLWPCGCGFRFHPRKALCNFSGAFTYALLRFYYRFYFRKREKSEVILPEKLQTPVPLIVMRP